MVSLQAPPFTGAVAGASLLYATRGDARDIDWDTPLAILFPNASAAITPRELSVDVYDAFAVRNVSAAGTVEHSTHVVALARRNAAGMLQSTVLPQPKRVSLSNVSDDRVQLTFVVHMAPGVTAPTAFDILGDDESGHFNLDEPLTTISAASGPVPVRATVTVSRRPCRLAVRARRNESFGPLSRAVTVAALRVPPSPEILP
jgi:hypothetical protein